MDVIDGMLDNALGSMASGLQAPSRSTLLSAMLRNQPSFADQPMVPTPTPQAMQPQQPQQPQPSYDPQRPLRRAMTAAGGYPTQPAAAAPPAAAQVAPQAPQQPSFDQEYQDLMRRQQEADAAEQRALQPPDRSAAEAAYRAHADSAMGKTMLALAAQQAGPGYQGMQTAWMHQAEDAEAPLKMAGGTMTPQGWIEDPGYAQNLAVQRAVAKSAAIARALEHRLTLAERSRLQSEKIEADKVLREMMVAGQKAVAAMVHGGGGNAGVGTWTAVGSDPDTGAQVFHNTKTNQLMTNDARGQPIPYTKTLGPKSGTNASEDERKSASQMAQAEGAKVNRDAVLAAHPEAAKPGLAESIAGWLPGQWGADIQNATRSGNRQLFTQAASSFGEAALRMATGAGMGEHEARQKIAELSPAFGDKEPVIRQKLAAWDQYLIQFKTRAGRAAPGAGPGRAAAPGAGAGDNAPDGSTASGPGGARMIKRNGHWEPA